MYIHSKDSLSLLKGIMTVQEELDKFHIDIPRDNSKSSGRESKVSPKIHRLRDPLRSRTPHDKISSKENYDSKMSKHDLSWHEDSRLDKSKDKKGSFFTIPKSVTPRDSVQSSKESLTKRPPSQPRSVNRSNTLSDMTNEHTSHQRNFENKNNYSSAIFDKFQSRDSSRDQQVYNSGVYYQGSGYNDDQAVTKTHLMNQKPALHPENVKSSHERLRSQAIIKANAYNFISRSTPNSCDVTKDYGAQDKNIRMSRFGGREAQKQNENDTSQSRNIPVEYNGTFAVNSLLKKVNNSPENKEKYQDRNTKLGEFKIHEGKELSMNNQKKTLRSQSSHQQEDSFTRMATPEINKLLYRDWQRKSQDSTNTGKNNLNLSYQGQEENKIPSQETKSTLDSENRGATGSFRTSFDERRILESRNSQVSEQNRLSVPASRERTNRGSYKSNEHSKSFTMEEEYDNSDLKGGNKEKNKGNNEKSQLMKTILELKNQIHERDLEILELRNTKVSNEIENKELQNQMSETLKQNKRNEDNLGKLQHQIECQEKEIEFLKKCKQRLEDSSKNAHKTNTELKDYMAKVKTRNIYIYFIIKKGSKI